MPVAHAPAARPDIDTIWKALNLLNLMDAILTLVLVLLGAAEANPIMAGILGVGVTFFLTVKCLGVFVLSAFLRMLEARVALEILAGVYWMIVALEAVSLLHWVLT